MRAWTLSTCYRNFRRPIGRTLTFTRVGGLVPLLLQPLDKLGRVLCVVHAVFRLLGRVAVLLGGRLPRVVVLLRVVQIRTISAMW